MENLLFYLKHCPYCKKARSMFKRIVARRPELAEALASFEWVDEAAEPERADKYDYYYVPTCYVNGVKLHEGVLSHDKATALLEAAKTAIEQ